jgi:GNAT superfamily N-acetyltransferase
MRLIEVKTREDLKNFIDLPWKIYKNYPHWVPPLKNEVEETLSKEKNPFFKHSEADYYIVKEGNETLGRIAAINNRTHNSFHNEKTGFFGFFETVEDYKVASLLFDTAETWCKKRDLNILRGPTSFSTNDECGFLIEGYDKDPVIMMPYNPHYYVDYSEKHGFRKIKDLLAFFYESRNDFPENYLNLLMKIKKDKNIRIRTADINKFREEIATIKEIYNSAWGKNWGFVPMTEEEVDLMASKFKPIVNPNMVLFAEISNKPIGFCLTIPDYNQVLKHLDGKLGLVEVFKFFIFRNWITQARLMALGVKKEYRHSGVELLLSHEVLQRCKKIGLDGELSWTLEDNALINSFIAKTGGVLNKKYRIYEKNIP